MANLIEFQLVKIGDTVLNLDGVSFSQCSYIKLLIDGVDIRTYPAFEDMLVVFNELKDTLKRNGNYLIFTCACGIADDDGWDYVNLVHKNNFINWNFKREIIYSFNFEKELYLTKILHLEKEINSLLKEGFPLIPKNVIFPE